MTPTGDALRPGEVALLLYVDQKTVTRWAKVGKLDSFRTPGGHLRIRRSCVERLLRGDQDGETPESLCRWLVWLDSPSDDAVAARRDVSLDDIISRARVALERRDGPLSPPRKS